MSRSGAPPLATGAQVVVPGARPGATAKTVPGRRDDRVGGTWETKEMNQSLSTSTPRLYSKTSNEQSQHSPLVSRRSA
jgi:hypothetical protein